ncbi:MAG TPA: aromatic amino acid ammonia-lyase [Kribbella sp.]|uniref:aromatic amino acid ammonia-lyase n=1 Tax=Kribbella sp. TaxID=1871183 RepID=UPI002D77749C|nr:aromatic amino acid ammonia-lyase [Kribbella sp.]HET6293448.1 aromatic amino acid ammonia-lyase [Kribbella sp.]
MEPVEISGAGLTPLTAVALGQRRTAVRLGKTARKRMADSAAAVVEVAKRQPVYGRTTGVGANRDVLTGDPEHGARLLASHSTTGTAAYPKDVVRLGLLIRVNQLAAGGSGLEPAVADAIVSLLNDDELPELHRGGAIGTGDLGPLAELGLALGDVIDGTSALPLLSSNAITLAECCLAYVEAATLINVVPLVGALSHVALRGNAEVYDARVHEARPQPGQVRVARRMRGLLDGLPLPPARVQDPFGLRAFAQVLGPAVDHIDALGNTVQIDINASAENPLVAGDTVLHNGNWHAMPIALALDSLRLSLHSVATLSTSRVANLVDPDFTGLSRFLASGAEASSGVMMIEYVAHDALASVRSTAQPATLGTATLSRGAEHHASFAPQAAVLTAQLLDALRGVLSCELVTAVRAIRLAGLEPEQLAPAAVGPWLSDALAALPGELRDRSLRDDLEIARGLLTQWGDRQVEHPAEAG